MINQIKRVLAVAALIAAAVFIGMNVYLLVTGQIVGKGNLILFPLSVFLMLGLLTLGINWLQNLKRKAEQEKQETEKSAQSDQAE